MQKDLKQVQTNKKEQNQEEESTNATSVSKKQKEQKTSFVVQSKKVQINDLSHTLLEKFMQLTSTQNYQQFAKIKQLKIEGNSYSKEVCEYLGKVFSRKQNNIQDLDINDIFVARLKQEIPISIQYIAKGLRQSHLVRLDISNNAVNPYGAKALLNFLQVAKHLRSLQISNCGLGPLGVKQIAAGFKGMPKLQLLSIGRNRMQNQGILYIAQQIENLAELKQLQIYQNTLRKQGLYPLFQKIRRYNVKLQSFDLCDNFVRDQATDQMCLLIKQLKFLKNLDLSDCLKQQQNEKIITALEETPNRHLQRLGFNFIQLDDQLALRLLQVVKQCPLKRLNIVGNDFKKKVKKAYNQAFKGKTFNGKDVLSKYQDDEDDQQQVTRLLTNIKLEQ